MHPTRVRTVFAAAASRLRAVLFVLLTVALTQCDPGTGPQAGVPGTVTYRLVSPNGAEGGFLASFPSAEVRGTGGSDARTEVISRSSGGLLHVAVVDRFGAEDLTFEVEAANASAPPQATLIEVVGPDNVQRSLSGYALVIVP